MHRLSYLLARVPAAAVLAPPGSHVPWSERRRQPPLQYKVAGKAAVTSQFKYLPAHQVAKNPIIVSTARVLARHCPSALADGYRVKDRRASMLEGLIGNAQPTVIGKGGFEPCLDSS